MHYKNGREAKAGDKVVLVSKGNPVISGVLHTLTEAISCNGRVAQTSQSDPYVNVNECLHVDDILSATIPDSTK